MLHVIAKADVNPYGRCSGRTLDDLIARRLAEVKEIDRPRREWPTRCNELGRKVVKRLEERIGND
jgi:hypothetical protein